MDEEIEEVETEPVEDEADDEIEDVTEPTLTYQVKNGRIINMVDGFEAMVQAIDKILKTERFVYPIYSDQYGNDFPELFGKDFGYSEVEVERMLDEALVADDRVLSTSVDEIDETDSTTLLVTGSCETVYGAIPLETEVSLVDES